MAILSNLNNQQSFYLEKMSQFVINNHDKATEKQNGKKVHNNTGNNSEKYMERMAKSLLLSKNKFD